MGNVVTDPRTIIKLCLFRFDIVPDVVGQFSFSSNTDVNISQQFPITFKLSGPAPNLGVRHGSVVAGARWGHNNTIQAAAWLVKTTVKGGMSFV